MAWEALRHPSYLHVVTEQSLISGQNFLILDGFKKSELLNVPRQSAEFLVDFKAVMKRMCI